MIDSTIVLRQLKADLIGKDSHRGITLTYAWMANQFGHFSLGFIPTIILFSVLHKANRFENNVLVSALLVSGFWLIFEIYNFLWPLLKDKILKNSSGLVFRPAWGNIAFDTLTDLLFFWIGTFAATFFIEFQYFNYYVFVVLVVTVIYPTVYWYKTKLYQDSAKYPFQYRLGQWRSSMSKENKLKVIDYLNKEDAGNHLLLFGSKKCGKTSLSVAIANELSIKHKACFYTTSMKLFSMFFDEDRDRSRDAWDWKSADTLVIDDINPGGSINDELVCVNEFKGYMDTFEYNERNRKILKEKNIIWVLGNKNPNLKGSGWISFLKEIGVTDDKIKSIDLEKKD